jgi:hypothetical protein
MIIDSDQIRLQLSPVLQRLINEVLAKSGDLPLQFWDSQEYEMNRRESLKTGGKACSFKGNGFLVIVLQKFEQICKEELTIAHELGHLWLQSHGLPRQGSFKSEEEKEGYKYCFGPLLEIMEHAIFYPWLKTTYKIDLYKVGNKRLVDFLRNELPHRKTESKGDQVSLIMNYFKFKVESDNHYWQERIYKAYSKGEFVKLREKAEGSLPIIQELTGKTPDPQFFIEKYHKVLEILNIKQEIWPDFAHQIF